MRSLWLCVFLIGCERGVPPAMSKAPSLDAPAAGDATVVFARVRNACDTSDHTVIVDDAGHFVANVMPGSRVSAAVAPGTHVFYAWSSRDVRSEKEPMFNPVSAIRVYATEEAPVYVALIVPFRHGSVTRCMGYGLVELALASPSDELRDTQPLVADRGVGQAALDAAPAHLEAHLELGRAKLAALDDAAARAARRARERAE
jgi:hypothetical protein